MNKQLIFSALTFLSIAYSFGQKLPKKEISEIKLKQHIQFLAADALEGRLTGSAGEKISADYIEKEFKAAGLQPVQIEENSSASYQHSFPFVRLRITTNKTKFANYCRFRRLWLWTDARSNTKKRFCRLP